MVDYNKAIKNAWSFASEPSRFLYIFLFYCLAIIVVGIPLLIMGKSIISMFSIMGAQSLSQLPSFSNFLVYGIVFVISVIFITLLALFIDGVFIHNFVYRKSLKESALFVKKRYLTMVLVSIIIACISFIGGLFPGILSVLISIIISLIFLFAFQIIIISNAGVGETIDISLKIFTQRFSTVLVTWLIGSLLSLLILVISAIPISIILILLIPSFIGNVSLGVLSAIKTTIISNIIPIVIGFIILLIGASISKLFQIGIVTDVYTQLKIK